MLYDYIQCPHRVWRDIYGPLDEKIRETNPFVQLLWDRGVDFEEDVVEEIGEFTDLSDGSFDLRFEQTIKYMKEGRELIYQGVLICENLIGIPDLLKRTSDGSYIPMDIKAAKAFQTINEYDEGKPKKHYAIQLCLYVEILKKSGFSGKNEGIIIDNERKKTVYSLNRPMGPRLQKTWQECYQEIKNEVFALIDNRRQNSPANAAICRLCPWYYSCIKWCRQADDLTNLFSLGRSTRSAIMADLGVTKTNELCGLDLGMINKRKADDKEFLKGVGVKTLARLKTRANVLVKIKKPVIHQPIEFPEVSTELFFDIETDPTQDLVYLHGLYERKACRERFIYFLAADNTPAQEKKAWKLFWDHIGRLTPGDYAVYYYSSYEKSTYKKMSKKYPDLASSEKVRQFFETANVIDLYQIVQRKTDWPLSSYSIKDIASYLGFKWRDESPSGALSIQWYNQYIETKDAELLKRIIEYNEDDCKAAMILKDKLNELKNRVQV